MAFTLTNPYGEGTDEELLAIARGQLAAVMLYGHAHDRDGRKIERSAIPELRKTIEWLEARIAAMTPPTPGGQINYARRRRAL